MAKDDLHPQSLEEALERWDAGESLFTIEMGGLGPGYEQALQITMMELLRGMHTADLPKLVSGGLDLEKIQDVCDAIVREKCKGLGLSGAQVGAASNLAVKFLTMKWEDVLNLVPKDRHIQISKNWPKIDGSDRV